MQLKQFSGKALAEFRTDKNLTQHDLTFAIYEICRKKIHPQTVSDWERGICNPKATMIAALSAILERPVDDFFRAQDYLHSASKLPAGGARLEQAARPS